jgi:hypothetical protein
VQILSGRATVRQALSELKCLKVLHLYDFKKKSAVLNKIRLYQKSSLYLIKVDHMAGKLLNAPLTIEANYLITESALKRSVREMASREVYLWTFLYYP